MSKKRDPIQITLLKQDAEWRMRRGEAAAEIATQLGISLSTLGNWAAEGGWRKKDIAFEHNEERGQALLARIAKTQIREHEEAEARAAKAAELGKAALDAMNATAPNEDGKPPGETTMPTHQLSLAMARTLLEQGNIAEAERAARFAMRFAQALKATNDRDAAQWQADRDRILLWWHKNREGIYSFYDYANRAIEELRERVKFESRVREEGVCPTCLRHADFWPLEMEEAEDKVFEKLEEEELRERDSKAESTSQDETDPLQGWFSTQD
jgi:hypothetical protein